MTAVAQATDLTLCCGQPLWHGLRCEGCGHRMPIGEVQAVETRELMRRSPRHAARIAWTELRDRRRARQAGGAR
jgi:hypothetical protein